jgi:hypothetical protein
VAHWQRFLGRSAGVGAAVVRDLPLGKVAYRVPASPVRTGETGLSTDRWMTSALRRPSPSLCLRDCAPLHARQRRLGAR